MAENHAIDEFFTAVDHIAGFRLPRDIAARFDEISSTTTEDPTPEYLQRLKPTAEGGRDWLQAFRISATYDVRHGLAASIYHFRRVSQIESEIVKIGLEIMPRMNLQMYAGIAGGNTEILDFEYQAFAFSLRRTLEYLAGAIGAFFKCEAHSIRDITRTIRNKRPCELSANLARNIDAGLETLSDILPREDSAPKSVRDRLAHWTAVGAGVINASRQPGGFEISVSGGGDNQLAWKSSAAIQLRREEINGTGFLLVGPILQSQLNRVVAVIFSILDELVPPRHGA